LIDIIDEGKRVIVVDLNDVLLKETGMPFLYSETNVSLFPENYMDRWILSFTQSLIKFVKEEMQGSDNIVSLSLLHLDLLSVLLMS